MADKHDNAQGSQHGDAGADMKENSQIDNSRESAAQTPEPTDKVEQNKQDKQQPNGKVNGAGKDDKPDGGFDTTPIPSPAPGTIGYTVKFTFQRAASLAIGDAPVMSSDPYILAQLNTDLPTRHKEDPNLRFRTPTIRRTTEPEWNEDWIVANVPSSGFKLKVRVYDEDPADHDDILGKVHISVDSINDSWKGVKMQKYQLRMRDSSKRALALRAAARVLGAVKQLRGEVFVSIENLGRTGNDGQNGRAYTIGPCRWIRHYSPILGRLTNTKDPQEILKPGSSASAKGSPTKESPESPQERSSTTKSSNKKKSIQHYNFQANEMQLQGPVPPQLYHRFVEFKPWVKRMFTTTGFQGVILGHALHHQHTRVYNFDRSTKWGYFDGPSTEYTQQFLDLVHWAEGGRIFTYVLTLDGLWRFTETGKEFGVDMLSKHTMHSDVSIYIAFSGEFFIRRLRHRDRPPPPHPIEGSSTQHPPEHEPNEVVNDAEEDAPDDPAHYELVIDNDSGTYRPNAQVLPYLAEFLAKSLPGLHIQVLDCSADAEKMNKMKDMQRDRKKREGQNIVFAQGDASSISSSEDERLNDVEAGLTVDHSEQPRRVSTGGGGEGKERGHFEMAAKDLKLAQKAKADKVQRMYATSRSREDAPTAM